MIDADTRVVITMKQFLGGLGTMAALVIATGVALGGFLYSEISTVRKSGEDNAKHNTEVSLAFTKEMGDLKGSIGSLNATVASLKGSVDTLAGRIDAGWGDPKRLDAFAEELKKRGLDNQPIIVIPAR